MSPAQTTPDVPQSLWGRIERFFYADEVPYGLAIVRILMPLVLLVPMLPRWPVARELYSLDGAPSPLWFNYGWSEMLPLFPGGVIVALHTLLIFFLICSSLGWKTRFSVAGATLLYVYINLCDSVSTITKYSVIASHVMLLLSLSQCGAIWSVDAWLKRRRRESAPDDAEYLETSAPGLRNDSSFGDPALAQRPDDSLPRVPAWPRRLMQLMIGIVYFGAAVTKMHTPEYFSGTQMQTWLLTNVNYSNPVGEYLSLFPALLVFFAYIAVVWEVLFLFLAWRGLGRVLMLSVGVGFHVATNLLLGLYVFPMVCITIYFAFLDEAAAERFGAWFRDLRTHLGWPPRPAAAAVYPVYPVAPSNAWAKLKMPSPIVYALVVLGVALLGVEIEHQRDYYGQRRPEGPYTLKEVTDTDLIARMLADPQPMRLKDMFDTFEIGTGFVGGLLFDRRDEFRQGEVVAAQVGLNIPHHDMWLECNLHDARGNQLDRVGQVVSREMLRANFYYTLGEVLEPGEYDFVLKSGGHEVTRRRIVLKPKTRPPLAN